MKLTFAYAQTEKSHIDRIAAIRVEIAGLRALDTKIESVLRLCDSLIAIWLVRFNHIARRCFQL